MIKKKENFFENRNPKIGNRNLKTRTSHAGFAHLDTLEVSVAELDELPDNFNGVESAKIDAEQAAGPAI